MGAEKTSQFELGSAEFQRALLDMQRLLIDLARKVMQSCAEDVDQSVLQSIDELRRAAGAPCLFFSLIGADGESLDGSYLSLESGVSGPSEKPAHVQGLGISREKLLPGAVFRAEELALEEGAWPCCSADCPSPDRCTLHIIHSDDRPFAVLGLPRIEGDWSGREEVQDLLFAGAEILCNAIAMSQTRNALRENRERLELAQFAGRSVAWDWDPETDEMFMSESAAEIYGYGPSVIPKTGSELQQRILPEDRERVASAIKTSLKEGTPYQVEHRFLMPDDKTVLWVRAKGRPLRDSDGRTRRLLGLSADITARKKAEAELVKEQMRAQITLNSVAEGVVRTDADGLIDYLNPAAESLCGKSAAEALNRPWREILSLMPEEHEGADSDLVGRCLSEGQAIRASCWYRLFQPSGREFSVQVSAAPLFEETGKAQGVVLVLQDLSEVRAMERERTYLASHDGLTGLLNRYEFEQRVTKTLTDASHGVGPHALCLVELDTFKVVNDSCGHVHGDNILRQVSALLETRIRGNDIFARIGGDEFGILMKDCDLQEAHNRAEEITTTIRSFRFLADTRIFSLGASLGIVPVDEFSPPFEELMMAADAACYLAKEKGRNTFHIGRPDEEEIARHSRQAYWAQKIGRCLEGDCFTLHGQHIFPLDHEDGRITEFLLRIQDGMDIVEPGSFLGAAERYHLMPDIDRWVVRHAIEIIPKLLREETIRQSFTINLSGQSLSQEGMLDFILKEIHTSEIDPVHLCFEITETAVISNIAAAKRLIRGLGGIGCSIALDDFGSGLSSFRYLKELSVQFLKIDGALVRDIATDDIMRSMVGAIKNVADTMGLKTIGEWVESEATLSELRELGINYAQGFVLDRPHPLGVDAP